MTIDELIDDCKMHLNMGGALPDILPEKEIRRLITRDAESWFYEFYDKAVIKSYLYVPNETLKREEFTKYSYIKLPCEVQNISWVYITDNRSLFGLGVSAPDLSVNLGVTNQPYLSSFTTTVGELGVYKVIIDGFADMLNQLTKNTLKFDYNQGSNQLHLLTNVSKGQYTASNASLVLEVFEKINPEDLYELDLFKRYVRALASIQMGRLLLRYDYNLPGGVKINSDSLLSEGKEEMEKVKEQIKSNSSGSSFFFMVKK